MHYPVDKYRGTNCTVDWIDIYPVNGVIHLLNNWSLLRNSNSILNTVIYNCNRILGKNKLDGTGQI